MPSKRHHYDSSSTDSSLQNLSYSRRRLPSPPPSGILRNANRHVTIVDPVTMSRRVDRIADNLEDASRNLRSVDTKLTDFKDMHDDSMSALTKLQEDLEGSLHRLRHTREKRSRSRDPQSLHRSDLHSRRSTSMTRIGSTAPPARDYESDVTDYTAGRTYQRPSSSLGISRNRHGDYFSSSIHDKVHDLSSSQARLEQDLNDEISKRLKSEKTTRQLNESMRGATASDRVERRLKEIERGMIEDRNSATLLATEVANDLLRRSQSKVSEEDVGNRTRLLQMETSKRAIESELEATRRRLEQSEGGREALMSQIGELRGLINKSDKERADLQKKVEQHENHYRAKMEREAEDRQRLAASERQERDRLRQENEIDELRAALKRSAGVVQLDEVRRDLEKSERQRQHLSDHIEVLTKDLEKKEQGHGRILGQLHDLQKAFDESEREKDRLYVQLEDALKKLKDITRDTDKYAQDLRKTVELKNESEKEKEEMRSVAQDTIRQWKSKCRKQEKDLERLQDNIEQLNTKNEEILKESINGKTQANNAFQQVENLRKEMDDLIKRRADMDERLRQREEDIEQISEEKRLLTKQLKDSLATSDTLEVRLRDTNDRLTASNNKLSKNEREMEGMKSMFETVKQQTAQLQAEIRELKLKNAELTSQVTSDSSEKKELEKFNEETSKQLQAMEVELNAVHKQLQIERDTHKKELKELHSAIHAGEVQKMEAVQKVSKKADEERNFLEGEIHRVNVEMNEAKAASRESQKLLIKAKNELTLFERDVNRLEGENKTWREKYQIIKSTYENKCSDVMRETSRVQKLEDDLLWSRDRTRRLEQQIETANNLLSHDVHDLQTALQITEADISFKTSMSESLETNGVSQGDAWINSLRNKLESIKNEVVTKMNDRSKALEELNKHKQNMKAVCRSMEDDKRQLMSEVTEQNKMVDSLSREKTSLLLENKEARMLVQDLEDRVVNLTSDLENSKARLQETISTATKLFLPTDAEESRKERERIQERYAKYKDTMNSLQADLEESRCKVRERDSLRMGQGKSPSPIKRVTIADTSPVRYGYSSLRPRSSSPKDIPEKER